MKNPLWYTNIFYPDMLQRKCALALENTKDVTGYVTEKMQKAQEAAKTENISRSADKKLSIRKELNSIKAAEKSMPKPTQTKKRDNLEL